MAISGCTSAAFFIASPVPPEKLPEYTLELELRGEPAYDPDGYEVVLGFDLRANGEFAYNAIVQEIVQETVYRREDGKQLRETLALVEAFELARVGIDNDSKVRYRLKPFQRDRHYERGYSALGSTIHGAEVFRVVRYYPAFVRDADWSALGFAHLPGNREGTIRTDIPKNFNERHQRGYIIEGAILQDDRARSHWYSMRYSWKREDGMPTADFAFRRDARPPDESAWLSRVLDKGMREAGAGE
ncbi:MAG: hypothetical protein IT462_07660 [Planctomycetes bacterium]|nr:hypothetical protein [Planctomycetota bacterium]